MLLNSADSELFEVSKRLASAERTKDIVTLKNLIADDYVGVGANGEMLSKTIILERFSNPALGFDRHELSDVQVRLLESVGLILGTVSLKGTISGRVFDGQFRFMDVCVKRSGRWEIVASQLTELSAQS
jgi:hypothetical protein